MAIGCTKWKKTPRKSIYHRNLDIYIGFAGIKINEHFFTSHPLPKASSIAACSYHHHPQMQKDCCKAMADF